MLFNRSVTESRSTKGIKFKFFIHSDTYTSVTRGLVYKIFYIMTDITNLK